jgi:predicted AlkP superfamily pyrophosphatase or phosphodiesterase
MASALVDELQLGRRETTDLLAISFSPLDLLGHDFGPDSREAEDLLLRLDADIGGLLRQLDTALGRDGYAVALTSDHGTASIPEQSGGGRIASEDVLQLVEQTLAGRWGVSGGAPYVAWVGPGSIYFAEGVFERLKTDAAAFEEVAAALESVPGVERVLSSDALAAPDSDPDRHVRAALAGYLAGRSGDLFLVARRNWIFELRSENDATNHGTSHEYDRRVPLVLRGHRFRPGRYRGTVSPADIAPTLAFITGIRMPNAEGRALTEAIR